MNPIEAKQKLDNSTHRLLWVDTVASAIRRPPLQELLRERAMPAIRSVFEAKILIDLKQTLLLVVITCE